FHFVLNLLEFLLHLLFEGTALGHRRGQAGQFLSRFGYTLRQLVNFPRSLDRLAITFLDHVGVRGRLAARRKRDRLVQRFSYLPFFLFGLRLSVGNLLRQRLHFLATFLRFIRLKGGLRLLEFIG